MAAQLIGSQGVISSMELVILISFFEEWHLLGCYAVWLL
jgi:hypothetical protein